MKKEIVLTVVVTVEDPAASAAQNIQEYTQNSLKEHGSPCHSLCQIDVNIDSETPQDDSLESEIAQDGVLYKLDWDAIINIDDEAYSPLSGAVIPICEEDDIIYVNETYGRVYEKETLVEKEFLVPVSRVGYSNRTMSVLAFTQDEANDKALDEAGNHEYSEHTSDYELC